MGEALCEHCGWPEDQQEVLSRHRTSEGTVLWARCVCGAVQMRIRRAPASEPVARAGRPSGWPEEDQP